VFICEPIEVETTESVAGRKEPAAFTWRGTRYVIEEIVSAWTDAGSPTRKWYQRRYRNYYRVRADDGKLYEIYLERPTPRRLWFLSKCLSPMDE